jgi:N-acetylneuraminic acid mutarotase
MDRDPSTQILKGLLAANDDAWTPKEKRWQWARPQVEGMGPSARGGHSATLVGARIFTIGGHRFGESGGTYHNDTFVLDVDANQWTEVRCKGTPPSPRYNHSAALVGNRIVVFGGLGPDGPLRDLHALDTQSHTWYQGPTSGGAPPARHSHTSNLHDTRLLVFGGAGAATTFGDIHVLDLACMAWADPVTSGPAPGPRMGHASLLVENHLIIHGGFYLKKAKATSFNAGKQLQEAYLNDMRVLDVGTFVWSRMRTHGVPPTGRFNHTMTLSGEDILVFGGWHGGRGSGKAEAGAGTTGGDGANSVDYCHAFSTGDMSWMRLRASGVPPSDRYGHSMTMVGPHAIVFAGWDGGKPLNDLVVLRDVLAVEGQDEQ